MRPLRFENPDIAGWVVQTRIEAESYVINSNDPEQYRRQFIGKGKIGRLTGTIFVLPHHNKTDEYKNLVENTELMRELLLTDNSFLLLQMPVFQRSSERKELYLSMPVIMVVEWQNSDVKKPVEHGHIIPWLELIT